jgi:hypothetical protein
MRCAAIVHIAGEPEGLQQRCARCGEVLINAEGTMSTSPGPIPAWGVGNFVGVVKGNPTCSFLMERDAAELDEQRCDAGIQ